MSAAPKLIPKDRNLSYPELPFDVEVEQALFGLMLDANDLIAEVQTRCRAEDFYDAFHRRVAQAIYGLDAERKPVTALTLKTALHGDPAFDQMPAGTDYLFALQNSAPAHNISQERALTLKLADDIASLATRRAAMISIWEAQEELSLPPKREVAEILKPVVAAADLAAERSETQQGASHVSVSAAALVRAAIDGVTSVVGTPVATGLTKLDEILGGFYPGHLIIAAGRPGMGKSTLATNVARAAADAGAHVEYFSPEMTKTQLAARLITDMDFDRYPRDGMHKPLSYSRLLKRRCSAGELTRAERMAEILEALQINVHDKDSPTIGDIAALSRAAAARANGPGIIIIDHLQIVRPTERYRGNRVSEITEITGSAKALAKRLNWPVLLLSQLNREVEKRPDKEKRPHLGDLRDSGSIEQDADVVIFLQRPGYYVERKKPTMGPRDPKWNDWLADYEPVRNHLDIDVAKNRDGEVDAFKCFVDIGASAIRDEDPDLAPSNTPSPGEELLV